MQTKFGSCAFACRSWLCWWASFGPGSLGGWGVSQVLLDSFSGPYRHFCATSGIILSHVCGIGVFGWSASLLPRTLAFIWFWGFGAFVLVIFIQWFCPSSIPSFVCNLKFGPHNPWLPWLARMPSFSIPGFHDLSSITGLFQGYSPWDGEAAMSGRCGPFPSYGQGLSCHFSKPNMSTDLSSNLPPIQFCYAINWLDQQRKRWPS